MAVPKHYAILIGIDAYTINPLRGATNDVESVSIYLEPFVKPANIRRLVAATKSQGRDFSTPAEDSASRPTYRNIHKAFDEVIQSAKAGDSVYIHYSGHGTHKPADKTPGNTPDSGIDNETTGDLALVVLSDEPQGANTYLWGRSLASRLNALLKKELIVTLVLDCCFSADFYRSNVFVRSLPYDSGSDSAIPSKPKQSLDESTRKNSVTRDISLLLDWFVDSDKYAMLVACGPHKEAGEIQLSDGRVVGKLTHFLLETLKKEGGVGNTVSHIYRCLLAEYRREGFPESPVFYGNKRQGFLVQSRVIDPTRCIAVIEKSGGVLELQAGQAHGVGVNDSFIICPSGMTTYIAPQLGTALSITNARAFTSDLEYPKDFSESGRRWLAQPVSQNCLREYPVRLSFETMQDNALRFALHNRSIVTVSDLDFSFCSVVLNSNRDYEIVAKGGQEDAGIPVLVSEEAGIDNLAGTLEHLARFMLVKDLDNKASAEAFTDAFEVSIIYRETSFGPEQLIHVNEDEHVELVVKNKGLTDLFVSSYNLGPFWQVENVGRAAFNIVAAGRSAIRRLQMIFPINLRDTHRSCHDILKIFVTSSPTSFDFLELPRLNEPSKRPKNRVQTDNRPEGDWTALSFPIQTLPTA